VKKLLWLAWFVVAVVVVRTQGSLLESYGVPDSVRLLFTLPTALFFGFAWYVYASRQTLRDRLARGEDKIEKLEEQVFALDDELCRRQAREEDELAPRRARKEK